MFVIHANLDAEARWGGGSLPGSIATRVSYYAALLSVLAPPDMDVEVWAPAPIDASRLIASRAWRPPTMRVGTPPRADRVWAHQSAKAANDRRLAHRLGRELDTATAARDASLLGADIVETVDAFVMWSQRHERWVAKAPWTTAGRDRCHGQREPTGEQRTRISRLLEKFGALVVEPWVDRIVDIGLCARVDEFRPRAGPEPAPRSGSPSREMPSDFYVTLGDAHSLVTDARGTFLGIDLARPALEPGEETRLGVTARAVGAHLAAMGFRGPFAIDAFVYRDAGGARQLHALCEINARTTFGHVARAFESRGASRLGFSAPPDGATLLVAPTNDGVTAWIA